MPAFGRGFLFAALGPRGCAPLGTPAGGAPCTARLTSASGGLPGPLAEGRGAGEERPRHPAGRLGSLRSRQGAVSSPLRGCGPHQPLDPPFTRKTRQRPAQGLGGHCRSGWGSRLAQRPRSSLALTPRNDPNTPGWWLGCSSPSRLPVANAPGGPPEALLPLIFASEVWGFGAARPWIRSQRNRPSEAQGGPFVYPQL